MWYISHAIDALWSMLEKLFRNWIKSLTSKELDLTNLVNMVSAAFSPDTGKIRRKW